MPPWRARGEPVALAGAAKTLPDLGRSANDETWLSNTRTQVDTAPLSGLVVADPATVDDPTSAERAWLQAGRLWQRLHLAMTVKGLATGPLNQLAELTDRERQLDRPPWFGDVLTGLAGPRAVPMMPFRVGLPTRESRPGPRRPLGRVVRHDRA